ncbi:unnamed protein product [Durusdinium trenchii]
MVDRAFQARKSPLEEELWLTQGRIHDKEMDLWKLEHGDDTAPVNTRFAWVQSWWFSTWALCLQVILVNLIIMFLQMKNDKLLGDWSIYVDVAFLTFYCFELIVKGCCYESSLLFGHCSVVWWNWLDLVIVMSGLLELVMPLLVSGSSPIHLSGLRGLRRSAAPTGADRPGAQALAVLGAE